MSNLQLPSAPPVGRLGKRLLLGCLACVLSVAAVAMALAQARRTSDAYARLRDHGESLMVATTAYCIEPLLEGDSPVVETYANMLCAKDATVAGVTVRRRDGRIVADISQSASRELVTIRRPVSLIDGDAPPIGFVELHLDLGPTRSALKSELLRDCLEMLALFAALSVSLTYLIHRRVSVPMRQLEEQALPLAHGELQQPVSLDTDDEFGQLSGTLDLMRRRLVEEIDRLRNLALELGEENQRRSAAEAKLLEALEEARAGTRARDAFLANASHEMRTPLTAILGYTDVLIRDHSLFAGATENHHAKDFLRTIRRQGDHLLELIGDLLELARIEARSVASTPKELSLAALLRDVESACQPQAAAKGLGLTLQRSIGLDRVVGDSLKIRQVLINLVTNAIKFTDAGRVLIRARGLPRDNGQTLVRIDVVDTGVGIDSDDIESIFDPFTRAVSDDRNRPGVGLGLAISHRLVEAMGGHLEVRSRFESGSRFRVELTLDVPLPNVQILPPRMKNRVTRDAPRVLVVDDSPEILRLVAFRLSSEGVSVETEQSGAAAVMRARNLTDRDQPYDAILLDMQMSPLSGYGVARRLREAQYDGQIIALTADSFPEDRDRSLEAGCDEHLSKPIDFGRLTGLLFHEAEPKPRSPAGIRR